MIWIEKLLSPEFYEPVLGGPFGFIFGILLAMVEAFFPPLPLAAFVTINVISFGFLGGYILSYLGTLVGSFLVFKILKRFGHGRIHSYIERHHRAQSLFTWIHDKGAFPIFVMLTFPFTPSIVVAGLAAFADVEDKSYLYALAGGKLLMVLSLSFIGVNIQSFLSQPLKSALFIVLTLSITFVAKYLLGLYEKHVLRKQKLNMEEIEHIKKNK